MDACGAECASLKWTLIDTYGTKLRAVAFKAGVALALQNLTNFVGLWALKCAIEAVFEGYVTEMSIVDSSIYIVAALGLGVGTFFDKTSYLGYLSPIPIKLKYQDSKKPVTVARIRFVQLYFLLSSASLSIGHLRLLFPQRINFHSLFSQAFHGRSLVIFHFLVLATAIIAGFAWLYSTIVVSSYENTPFLQRFFDEIVSRGWEERLLKLSECDFMAFFFEVQAEAYRRNVQPAVVCEEYKDMMRYVYLHEKGAEVARILLKSGDSYEQQAAANIVGFWVPIERALNRKKLRYKKRLLMALVKAAGGEGATGRAAVLSIGKLAEWDPEGVLEVRSDVKVGKVLMKAISERADGWALDDTLPYVKATIALLQKKEVLRKSVGEEAWVKLRKDLRRVWKGEDCRVRTKAVAGWALLKMNGEDEICRQSARENLANKRFREAEYVHAEEFEYLKHLLEIERVEQLPQNCQERLQIRSTNQLPDREPFLARCLKGREIQLFVFFFGVQIGQLLRFLFERLHYTQPYRLPLHQPSLLPPT